MMSIPTPTKTLWSKLWSLCIVGATELAVKRLAHSSAVKTHRPTVTRSENWNDQDYLLSQEFVGAVYRQHYSIIHIISVLGNSKIFSCWNTALRQETRLIRKMSWHCNNKTDDNLKKILGHPKALVLRQSHNMTKLRINAKSFVNFSAGKTITDRER